MSGDGTKGLKVLESSLDTIRRTALKLLEGMENQLREMRRGKEQIQGERKESLLLIQHHNLSEYSLVRVRGMDAKELTEALLYMNDDDRQSISKYLENKGSETIKIAGEAIGNSKEYSPDVWYSTDTNEVINLTAKMGQNEKAEGPAERNTDKETDLLRSGFDKYGIYQLRDYPELEQFRFKGTEALKRMGIANNLVMIKPENYNLIYTGRLSELQKQPQEAVLEAVYQKFNTDRPEGFKGHSLSVSDIVVLHENGKNSAHFVDSFGFTELPDFMRELEGIKEQSVLQGIPEQDSLKSKIEQIEIKQTEAEQTQIRQPEAEQAESQAEQKQDGPEREAEIPEFKDIDDEDEIIDLGEEREQVLAEMKKSLDRLAGNAETEEHIEAQRDVTADFKAKTKEMFHEISGMNPSEIEKIVKYHVKARLEEYGISAKMTDAAVAGSRCRSLEHEDSDLDVVVKLSTNEREDVLFHAFSKKEQRFPVARASLELRLAEKKMLVSGQGKVYEEQGNTKKNQREV